MLDLGPWSKELLKALHVLTINNALSALSPRHGCSYSCRAQLDPAAPGPQLAQLSASTPQLQLRHDESPYAAQLGPGRVAQEHPAFTSLLSLRPGSIHMKEHLLSQIYLVSFCH